MTIRIELSTSVEPEMCVIDQFYPNWEKKCGNLFFWSFTDKESFIKILEMFLEVIIEAGLDRLDELSIVDENKIILNEEMFGDLYNKHDELCEKFIKTYKVSINDITVGIKKIYELYEEHKNDKNDKNEDVINLIIEMAAYYGNSFCVKFNGKWVWEYGSCVIILHARYGEEYLFPLQSIVSCWNNNDKSNYLMELYNELL